MVRVLPSGTRLLSLLGRRHYQPWPGWSRLHSHYAVHRTKLVATRVLATSIATLVRWSPPEQVKSAHISWSISGMTQNWGKPCPVGSHDYLVYHKTAVHRGDRATQVSTLLKSDLFGSVSCAAGLATAEKGGLWKQVILTWKQSRVSGNSNSIGFFS